MAKDSKVITAVLAMDVYRKMKHAAVDNDMNISEYVRKLIMDDVKKREVEKDGDAS